MTRVSPSTNRQVANFMLPGDATSGKRASIITAYSSVSARARFTGGERFRMAMGEAANER
jgi:hypothetical protein